MIETIVVDIKIIDGTECTVPVFESRITENQYTITESEIFDYEDESLLFEYGQGDIILINYDNESSKNVKIKGLIKEGDQRNALKRSQFQILNRELKIDEMINKFGLEKSKRILLELKAQNYIYPEVKNWLCINSESIERIIK